MAIINARVAGNNFVTDTIQNMDGTTSTMYRLPNPQEAVEINPADVALAGAEEKTYIQPNKDAKTIVYMEGTGSVTFKAGDTFAGLHDYTANVTSKAFVAIESAKFINKRTGLIEVIKTGNTKLAVLEVR